MKVLFLNQFYAPDIAATAQVLAALCQDLAAQGHEVSVLCGQGRYRQTHLGVQRQLDEQLPAIEHLAGVHVCRVPMLSPSSGPGARSLPMRATRELYFSATLFAALRTRLLTQPPDVLVVMSTPPTLLGLAQLARRLSRRAVPIVYWAQDIYPQLLFATDTVAPSSLPGRLLSWIGDSLVPRLFAQTDAIIALDQAMQDRLVQAHASPQKITVIEHAADVAAIVPLPVTASTLRQQLALPPDALVIGYAGNFGRGHDFQTLADLWRLLSQPDAPPAAARLHFLLVGDGERLPALRRSLPAALAARVHFYPPQADALLNDTLCAADIALITLGAHLAGLLTPSKLYPLLAAGRPILYVGPSAGRVAQLCADEPIGASVRNGDVTSLLAACLQFLHDPARTQAMGQHARWLAESRFDRTHASRRHAQLLTQLVTTFRTRAAPQVRS